MFTQDTDAISLDGSNITDGIILSLDGSNNNDKDETTSSNFPELSDMNVFNAQTESMTPQKI